MSKKKDKIEGISSELLEIAEIESTDKTNVPESTEVSTNVVYGVIQEAEEENKNPANPELRKKKEKALEKFSYVFYQYTIKRGDNPAIIIYSRNLPKEQINEFNKSVVIKEAFVETVVSQEFLGFKVSASYKEKIENYELSYDSVDGGNWMIVTELVVLDEWVLTTKNDVPSILQTKKEELILHLDQMQKEGKIQIKKK